MMPKLSFEPFPMLDELLGRCGAARPMPGHIPPIAFELAPRSFLRLHFDRTN